MPYTTQQVADRSGATIRQLSHWADRKYLMPIARGGVGTNLEWPDAELKAAQLMARFRRAGIDVEQAARISRLIVEGRVVHLVIDGEDKGLRIQLAERIWIVVENP